MLVTILTIAAGSVLGTWLGHQLGYTKGHRDGFARALNLDRPPGVRDDDIGGSP